MASVAVVISVHRRVPYYPGVVLPVSLPAPYSVIVTLYLLMAPVSCVVRYSLKETNPPYPSGGLSTNHCHLFL